MLGKSQNSAVVAGFANHLVAVAHLGEKLASQQNRFDKVTNNCVILLQLPVHLQITRNCFCQKDLFNVDTVSAKSSFTEFTVVAGLDKSSALTTTLHLLLHQTKIHDTISIYLFLKMHFENILLLVKPLPYIHLKFSNETFGSLHL